MGGVSRLIAKAGGGALLAGVLALGGLAPAAAQTPEEFYRGNTITLLVGYSPGGTYDITARLIAQHMGKHIPGNPQILVENLPGGGSMTALLRLYGQAPRDGTTIGVIKRSYVIDPLINPEGQDYSPDEFIPIGSTSSEVSVAAVWHTAGVTTFDDLQEQRITVGATSATDGSVRFPVLAQNLAGAQIHIIPGYPGGNDVTLAMERGEVDGRFGWSWGSVKSRSADWLENEMIHIIWQMGLAPAPDLPDVPFVMDYAETELDRNALQLLFSPQGMAWPVIAPPGVPADRIEVLRAAFDATMTDPEFIADAERLEIEVDPVQGAVMEELVQEVLGFDQEVIDRAIELTRPQ